VHSIFPDKITFKENTEFTALNYKGVAAGSLNEGSHNGDSVCLNYSKRFQSSVVFHRFIATALFCMVER